MDYEIVWSPVAKTSYFSILEYSGPVNITRVVATEAIFSQDKTQRVLCGRVTLASGNAVLWKNGPGPSGCAQNDVMRRYSSFM
jgi:hypothetical protein